MTFADKLRLLREMATDWPENYGSDLDKFLANHAAEIEALVIAAQNKLAECYCGGTGVIQVANEVGQQCQQCYELRAALSALNKESASNTAKKLC